MQVVWDGFSANPDVAASCKLLIPDPPVLLNVTIWVALTWPTSVAAKVS